MKMHFEKYEGLGNDFLLLRGVSPELPDALVQQLCDRHRGVGADGILLLLPGRSPGAVASMVVRNGDGSRPEMCGNGLRCVAASLAQEQNLPKGQPFVVDTDAGPRQCCLQDEEVTVAMGMARSAPQPLQIPWEGRTLSLWSINMGNPHGVLFEGTRPEPFATLGPALATHEKFPEGANIEFVQVEAHGVFRVRVWERGVGPTLACGTGACAVAVAGCLQGLASFETPITVQLPGGPLRISLNQSLEVRMTGAARFVFSGALPWHLLETISAKHAG
jgi:diaminopimelate epimerase